MCGQVPAAADTGRAVQPHARTMGTRAAGAAHPPGTAGRCAPKKGNRRVGAGQGAALGCVHSRSRSLALCVGVWACVCVSALLPPRLSLTHTHTHFVSPAHAFALCHARARFLRACLVARASQPARVTTCISTRLPTPCCRCRVSFRHLTSSLPLPLLCTRVCNTGAVGQPGAQNYGFNQ